MFLYFNEAWAYILWQSQMFATEKVNWFQITYVKESNKIKITFV